MNQSIHVLNLTDVDNIQSRVGFEQRCPILVLWRTLTALNSKSFDNASLRYERTMASSLIKWLRGLYVFFLTCLLSVLAFLNLEELNEMKYGIQILPDPVIMGQVRLFWPGLQLARHVYLLQSAVSFMHSSNYQTLKQLALVTSFHTKCLLVECRNSS